MFQNTNQQVSDDSHLFIQSIVLGKNWNSFLNLVFSNASEQELRHFFEALCELQKDNYHTSKKTMLFFDAIYESLTYIRKNDSFYFDFDIFLEHFQGEVLLKIYKTRRDLPIATRKKLLNALENIEGYDDSQTKQSKAFITSSSIIAQQIKNIFLSTSNLFIDKDFLFFCEQIAEKYQNVKSDLRVSLLSNIIYESKVTPENRDKLIFSLKNNQTPIFINPDISSKNIVSELLKGVSTKNESQVINSLGDIVNLYKKEFKIDELSKEDKIKIFFSPYFKKYNEIYENIVILLLSHYNEKIFNRVFTDYNLHINCPIRFDKDVIQTEEKEDKIYKKFVKKINYYNITEYCLENGLEHIAEKLFKKYKAECFANFDSKTIDNDLIYHYNYHFLKNCVTKKESHLKFLIKNKLINIKTNLFYKKDSSLIIYDNILFYLIYNQYYNLFNELFNSEINKNFDFKTLKTKTGENLFLFFIHETLEKMENNIQLVNYDSFATCLSKNMFETNDINDISKEYLSLIGKMDINQLIHILNQFHSIIPMEWFNDNKENFFHKQEVNKSLINEKKINWFNRPKLEQHFEKLSQQKDSSNIPVITQMLQNDNHLKRNLFVENENIFYNLEEEFPNFKKVINFYKGQFRIKTLSQKINMQPVLLLGPPGIGKTYFAKKLAEYLKTGYTFLDMGSMSAKWILSGANGTWKDAKQGKILESILNSPTINPVIVMDEIDKARGGDFDPTVVLYQLLEEINAKEFTDEFIDFSFNASGVIYIACANDAYKLSEPLLSRFKIFEIDLPNDDQFGKIIHNIYTEATSKSNIFAPNLSKDIFSLLQGKSMRNIKSIIQDAINVAITEINLDEIEIKKKNKNFITLKEKHFSSLYKKPAIGF